MTDLETIALLLGMMIVVANLRLSGFFRQVTAWIVAQARSPLVLLAGLAILGGVLLLFTRRIKPAKVYREVDWLLLVMSGGLFVVVAGLEKAVLNPDALAAISRTDLKAVPVLAAVTAVLPNLVSNVPVVLVLRPFIAGLSIRRAG